ncbi:MAG: hypothetical protein ACRDJH_19035, partial [Thermomicrobiales bacterium]
MIIPLFLRLVVLTLTVAVALVPALAHGSPGAAGTREVSETTTREDLFVQECNGFDAVTGYTVTRDYRFVTDPNGDLVFERRHVRFSGAFANAETGRAMPYQGEFTRIADYDQGQTVIADLAVHLDLPDTGSVSYAIDLRTGDLADNPLVVLRELASHATAAGLCNLLAGFPNAEPTGPLDLLGPASEVGEAPMPYGDLCGT